MDNENNDLSVKRFSGRAHWLNKEKPLVSYVDIDKLWDTKVCLLQYELDETNITKNESLEDSYENLIKRIFEEKITSVELGEYGTAASASTITTAKARYEFFDLNPNGDTSHDLFLLHCYLTFKHGLDIRRVGFYYYQNDSFFIGTRTSILLPHFRLYSFGTFKDGFLIINQLAPKGHSCAQFRYMYKKFYEETEVGKIQLLDPDSFNFLDERFWIDPDDLQDFKLNKESDISFKLSQIDQKLSLLIGLIRTYVSNLVTIVLVWAGISLLVHFIGKFF